MPCKKKKYNARFPPARIKKIMQTDEDVGKVAAAVPVIISRSLELFIDSLIERTATITTAKNAKTLSTSHIKQAIYSEKTFDFLRDLVKNIPDHQVDEDGEGTASGSGPQEKKPKPAKPRKPREDGVAPRGRGRPRKIKPEPEMKKESSSEEEEEDDDEATESDEEQNLHGEPGISDNTLNSHVPQQGMPQQGMPQQGMPQQGMQQQGMPQQGMSQQGMQQGMLQQGIPQQGIPHLSMSQQGMPQQGMPQQGMPQQGMSQQGMQHSPSQPGSAPPQQQYFSPPYPTNLAPPPSSIPPVQSSFTAPSANMSNEHSGNPHYNPMLMSQGPYQQQPPYPMHNYSFPQYVMPPGAPHMGPPQFMDPGTSSNMGLQSNLQSQIPLGQPSYRPPVPTLQNFAGVPVQDSSFNGTQSRPQYQAAPGYTPPNTVPYTPGQPGPSSGDHTRPTSHPESNMPIDMSIGGKPRYMIPSSTQDVPSERTSQHAAPPFQQAPPTYVPRVPYTSPPHNTDTFRSSPSNQRSDLTQHSQTANQLQRLSDTEPIENKVTSVSQTQSSDSAAVTREVTPPKLPSQDKDKSLVSFPGLSNIMKMNSLKPVNNNEDDDYDT